MGPAHALDRWRLAALLAVSAAGFPGGSAEAPPRGARPALYAKVDAGADAGVADGGIGVGPHAHPPLVAKPLVLERPVAEKKPPRAPKRKPKPSAGPRPKAQPKAEAPAAIEAAKPPPIDRSKCSSCHAALTADKKVHAAARKDEGCVSCHKPVKDAAGKCGSEAGAKWQLAHPQPALCQKCHQQGSTGKAHTPLKSACTTCHDPHASKAPSLMKTWPLEASCYRCHPRLDDDKSVHAPIKKGDCKGCHDPHSSEFAPLLVAEKGKLCFECHKADKLKHGKAAHTPFAEGRCLDCHDPHRSEAAPVLRASGKALCLECHGPKASGAAAARAPFRIDLGKKKVHKPLQGDGTCQTCHTQKHGGATRALLTAPTAAQTCFKCHQKYDDLPYVHGAVKTGKCTGCHDPHSADEPGLLRASKKQQVCFACHKDDLTGRRVIHKPIEEKGCTACHDPHGGDHPFSLEAEGKDLCHKCHKPVGKVQRPHAALTRYGCTGCHDPHGSDNPALLGVRTNPLCISCHEKQRTGDHFATPAHKMSGGSDPKHREKEFSCVSCHDPHGTDNPKLFYFGTSAKNMCVYCHGDKTKNLTRAAP